MTDDISLYGQLSPMKPQALAGYRVGDLVESETLGRCEVIELRPPSLLKVKTATGCPVLIGWRAARKVNHD